jgi:hypothetical protein
MYQASTNHTSNCIRRLAAIKPKLRQITVPIGTETSGTGVSSISISRMGMRASMPQDGYLASTRSALEGLKRDSCGSAIAERSRSSIGMSGLT